MVFQWESHSLEGKSVLAKMASSLLPMILDWVKPSPFMEEISTFMIVMSTQENSMNNWDNHKDHLSNTKTINGQQRLIINGSLKRTLSWKNTLKKNSVVVKLTLKNNSCKMTEKFLNSIPDFKVLHTSFITSLLMTQLKFVNFHFQTLVKIRSLLLSEDKNSPDNLRWTNQGRHTQRIS